MEAQAQSKVPRGHGSCFHVCRYVDYQLGLADGILGPGVRSGRRVHVDQDCFAMGDIPALCLVCLAFIRYECCLQSRNVSFHLQFAQDAHRAVLVSGSRLWSGFGLKLTPHQHLSQFGCYTRRRNCLETSLVGQWLVVFCVRATWLIRGQVMVICLSMTSANIQKF